jgi:hypothetical protein
VTEVQADGERGVGGEGDIHRRAAGRARALVVALGVLVHDAGALQLVDQRRDRRPRQAGQARHVVAARAGIAQQRLHHAQAVELSRSGEADVVRHSAPSPGTFVSAYVTRCVNVPFVGNS